MGPPAISSSASLLEILREQKENDAPGTTVRVILIADFRPQIFDIFFAKKKKLPYFLIFFQILDVNELDIFASGEYHQY